MSAFLLSVVRRDGARYALDMRLFHVAVQCRAEHISVAPVERSPTRAVAALLLALAACSAEPRVPALHWYVNPDNGAQARLAARCERESGGRYRIDVSTLPNDATQQREQLVRRLAAKDASIDVMSLDLPFVPELAEAGFLRPFSEDEARELTAGVLDAPLRSARWAGKLVAAPFNADTQLLWYRRSVARRGGLDPAAAPVTWSGLVAAATRTGTTVEVQGKRYEGYMVWINALVASAGGRILQDPEAGKDVTPGLDSAAGRRAASVIRELALSPAANRALSTADEEATRAAFQGARGGFMVNWTYVYGAARDAVAAGALDRAVLDDVGWSRYPRVDAGAPSRPPLGGIDLAVGAFSRRGDLAAEAVRCLASTRSQVEHMIDSRNPAARAAAYDDARVRALFPMADLVRESIAEAEPRPRSAYYSDVSAAVVRTFHPERDVEPDVTPARAARLVVDVLHDRVLL
jgi:multiple sugar transport system substrate-binding protein